MRTHNVVCVRIPGDARHATRNIVAVLCLAMMRDACTPCVLYIVVRI